MGARRGAGGRQLSEMPKDAMIWFVTLMNWKLNFKSSVTLQVVSSVLPKCPWDHQTTYHYVNQEAPKRGASWFAALCIEIVASYSLIHLAFPSSATHISFRWKYILFQTEKAKNCCHIRREMIKVRVLWASPTGWPYSALGAHELLLTE